jgi:hypothetical protein
MFFPKYPFVASLLSSVHISLFAFTNYLVYICFKVTESSKITNKLELQVKNHHDSLAYGCYSFILCRPIYIYIYVCVCIFLVKS